ncbi:MAG: alpha/beta hydrolase family protein [Pyrinomonadaceae bacterium]
MSRIRRPGKKLFKALLPVALLLVLGLVSVVGWLVVSVVRPPRRPYLLTPQTFMAISQRAIKVSEESWPNHDGTRARGWLLRGAEGAPAVVMLHGYGADRSWLFNLGVKINEASNYTILWPDLRGHGMEPPVGSTSLGRREAEDVLAAVEFLRALKTPQQRPLVGPSVGYYGVELGGYAALLAAALRPADEVVPVALALDSVPTDANLLMRNVLRERFGVTSGLLQKLARWGTNVYFLGSYESAPACAAAARLGGHQTLLLTGADAGALRDSTIALSQCFPDDAQVELQSEIGIIGADLASAPGAQAEAYERRVIDFFERSLGRPVAAPAR